MGRPPLIPPADGGETPPFSGDVVGGGGDLALSCQHNQSLSESSFPPASGGTEGGASYISLIRGHL